MGLYKSVKFNENRYLSIMDLYWELGASSRPADEWIVLFSDGIFTFLVVGFGICFGADQLTISIFWESGELVIAISCANSSSAKTFSTWEEWNSNSREPSCIASAAREDGIANEMDTEIIARKA
ncbi:MAG: hypothetical protein JJT78_12495 [Leptospira sp.]|nr:hypothetical protein [Leptospira sp.]